MTGTVRPNFGWYLSSWTDSQGGRDMTETEAERFWELDARGRAAVLAHMQEQGATAIVAESPALGVNIEGWERLPSAGVPRSELIVYGGLR